MRSAMSWASAVARLWRDIARGRVPSLYLVCSRSNAGFLRDVPALLAARVGIRTVVHVHGSDIVDLLSNRWLSPLARALYARCEVVVPSSHLIEPLRTRLSSSIHLCENYLVSGPVDAGGETKTNGHPFTVLWNSNVMASKGFFDLVEAMGQVHSEGQHVRLIVLGEPLADEEMTGKEVASRLKTLSTFDWINYRGKIPSSEVAAMILEADAVALPSRYSSECQPLALIQAMCAGKALVISDTPALQATAGDYPAHFVPVRSMSAIVEALRDLCRAKQAGHADFASAREEAAAVARVRFSTARFDGMMLAILLAAGSS